MVPTPLPCRESTLRGGCPPPLGKQGLPTRLLRSRVLLNFTRSERAEVRERALGRIQALSYSLAQNCLEDSRLQLSPPGAAAQLELLGEPRPAGPCRALTRQGSSPGHAPGLRALPPAACPQPFCASVSLAQSLPQSEGAACSPVSLKDIQIPILGQLLGRLILFGLSNDKKSWTALDALDWLQEYIQQQQSRSMPKDKAHQLPWGPETSSRRLAMAKHTVVTNYLTPSERTDIVLEAIEALRDSSIFDQEVARILLDVVMEHPDFSLAHVPKIMSCIHQHLECISMKSARRSVGWLVLLLIDQCPTTVFTAMLTLFPPGDRSAMAMWEMIFSMPQAVEEIFNVLRSKLQIRSVDASAQVEVSLFLDVLIGLSQRAGMAGKMQVLLPHMLEVLQHSVEENRMKALLLFPHVMSHLSMMEASPIAVQLAEKLLPLFDEGSSALRELSIRLFRDLLEAVVGSDKERMEEIARRALLPLFLHMSDQSDSVAQASGEAVLAAGQLLKCEHLEHLMQMGQTWRIAECLLVQDRSRAGNYCLQSLPYLQDAQATLREAAVRFIGLAARDQSEEQLRGIISALEPLDEDSDANVRVLATQTISILRARMEQPSSGRSLRALCCWCC
ncbi:uncharacterized protein O3Q21_012184 [Podargus strigoides]